MKDKASTIWPTSTKTGVRTDKAIEYLHQSLTLTAEAKDSVSEAQALNNLGNIYQVLSQYDKAVEYYQESLSISRQINDTKGQAIALNNLGIVVQRLGPVRQGCGLFRRVLDYKPGSSGSLS